MSFKIKAAQYGLKGQSVDVTEMLVGKVSNDHLSVAVTNETFKGDPAPLNKKVLKIEYELDGETFTKFFVEGVIAELPYAEKSIKQPGRFTLNLPEVTLATACWGNGSFLSSAVWAYKQFKDKVTFGEKVFFISEKIDHAEYEKFFKREKIKVVPLPKDYTLDMYSHFVVKEIVGFVKKDFLMLFQNDGFIDNIDRWTDSFLEYDYIGAPWWYKDENNVGNGGFSIRSKKLLKVLAEDDKIKEVVPEDHHICRTYGKYLREEHKIKFAPENLALKFSVEHGQYKDQLGFHSSWQLENYLKRRVS